MDTNFKEVLFFEMFIFLRDTFVFLYLYCLQRS